MKSFYLILNRVIYFLILIIILNPIIKPQSAITHPEKIFTYKDSFKDGANHSPVTINQLNNYDVKCYMLDLNVSKSSTEIAGSGTIYAVVQSTPLDTFTIELIDSLAETTYMIVDSVKINGVPHNFIHNDNLIKVEINPPMPVNSYITSVIYYHGNGQGIEATGYNGIGNGSEFGSSVTVTYSEPYWSYVWWPCKQLLSDKADSVLISITTDSDCKAGSNGILKSVTPLPGDKIRYEWESNYPIAYYLISFAVGQYIEDISYAPLNGGTDSVMIQSYLFQNCPILSQQMTAIQKTKKFIQLFGDLFGTYPFAGEKYGYCLDVGPWGAMENQTMTTLGYLALDTTAGHIGNYYYWYTAHELAHSWFGDNVTCATWQDVWINEGFASYGEYLALQNLESQISANYWMNNAQQTTKSLPGGSVFIPLEYINEELQIFDYRLSYKKGAAIVHILRYEIGNDSLFFLTLRNFQNDFKDSVATGLDFKNVLEQTTGQDFTDFFNQWYFGEGYPVFDITWTQTNDTLKIHSLQSTSASVTPLFKMHLELKLFYQGGDTLIKIYQQFNDQYFDIYVPHLISNIWVDPDHWVILNSTLHHTDVIDDYTPESFHLYQNFPNPFNSATKIKFHIPHLSKTVMKIFDVLGNEVAMLVNSEKPAGDYEIEFDASSLTSGVYFYQLRSGLYNESKKMLLLR